MDNSPAFGGSLKEQLVQGYGSVCVLDSSTTPSSGGQNTPGGGSGGGSSSTTPGSSGGTSMTPSTSGTGSSSTTPGSSGGTSMTPSTSGGGSSSTTPGSSGGTSMTPSTSGGGSSSTTPGSSGSTSSLTELFKGDLQGMQVGGSIKMKTGEALEIDVLTSITNNEWSLEASFSLQDGRCDFREVKLGAQLNIVPPKNIQQLLAALGQPETIKVSDIKNTISFLPKDSNTTTLPTSTTIDVLQLAGNTVTKSALNMLGADVTFTMKNPVFMLSGISFQLFLKGSVMGVHP